MATVSREIVRRTLGISVTDGVDGSGSAKTKIYSYNGLKNDASDAGLLQAGEALGSLMQPTVQGVRVTEVAEILEIA